MPRRLRLTCSKKDEKKKKKEMNHVVYKDNATISLPVFFLVRVLEHLKSVLQQAYHGLLGEILD
jgi:hypothetical protein